MATATVAFARVYQRSFDTHPSATLACTNGALTAIGDGVAQAVQGIIGSRTRKEHDPPFRYDPVRTLRFFTFGVAMGPLIGKWNVVLEKYFPLRKIGQTAADPVSVPALAKRVAVDQLFMAPIGLVLFIGSMGLMEGRDKAHISQKYSDMYLPALQANWQVWPLAQLVNFRYMPLPYRVPFQSTCGVFWTLYLSVLNAGEDKKQDTYDAMRGTADMRAANPSMLIKTVGTGHVGEEVARREQQLNIETLERKF